MVVQSALSKHFLQIQYFSYTACFIMLCYFCCHRQACILKSHVAVQTWSKYSYTTSTSIQHSFSVSSESQALKLHKWVLYFRWSSPRTITVIRSEAHLTCNQRNSNKDSWLGNHVWVEVLSLPSSWAPFNLSLFLFLDTSSASGWGGTLYIPYYKWGTQTSYFERGDGVRLLFFPHSIALFASIPNFNLGSSQFKGWFFGVRFSWSPINRELWGELLLSCLPSSRC